jgi:hypothetical protein
MRARGTRSLRLEAPLNKRRANEYYERVLDGTGELRVCELVLSPSGPATRVQACLTMRRTSLKTSLELQVSGPGSCPGTGETPRAAPPALLAEQALAVSG